MMPATCTGGRRPMSSYCFAWSSAIALVLLAWCLSFGPSRTLNTADHSTGNGKRRAYAIHGQVPGSRGSRSPILLTVRIEA